MTADRESYALRLLQQSIEINELRKDHITIMQKCKESQILMQRKLDEFNAFVNDAETHFHQCLLHLETFTNHTPAETVHTIQSPESTTNMAALSLNATV